MKLQVPSSTTQQMGHTPSWNLGSFIKPPSSIFEGTGNTGSDVSQSGLGNSQVSSELRKNGQGDKDDDDDDESFGLAFGTSSVFGFGSPSRPFELEDGVFKGDKTSALTLDGNKDVDPSDSDIETHDVHSVIKMTVPEPLLSELSDSEDQQVKTPRSSGNNVNSNGRGSDLKNTVTGTTTTTASAASAPTAPASSGGKKSGVTTSSSRPVKPISKLSESESSEDEAPMAPTSQPLPVSATKSRARGRPRSTAAAPGPKEKAKRPGRPPRKSMAAASAPLSRERLDTTTSSTSSKSSSSSSSSSSSDSDVDVEKTPSPLKRKLGRPATVTPPTTPRKAQQAQSPSKLASTTSKMPTPPQQPSRVLFPRRSRSRSSSSSSSSSSSGSSSSSSSSSIRCGNHPSTAPSGKGKGQPRPRHGHGSAVADRDEDMGSDYSPPKLDTNSKPKADRNKSVSIMKVFGGGAKVRQDRAAASAAKSGKQQPKGVTEKDPPAATTSATSETPTSLPNKTVAPAVTYVNGRPSLLCQLPLSKLTRPPPLPRPPSSTPSSSAAASATTTTTTTTDSRGPASQPAGRPGTTGKSNSSSSISSTASSSLSSRSRNSGDSLTSAPPIGETTPSHRKESKRKRKSDEVLEEDLKKRSRKKCNMGPAAEETPVPAPAKGVTAPVPSDQDLQLAIVKKRPCPSPATAVRPPSRNGQPSQPPNLVYFSYFEEPPAHQLEQEDRDHNHFLNEAKALKHAADKQVSSTTVWFLS